jgi:Ger(x)C family germination protein
VVKGRIAFAAIILFCLCLVTVGCWDMKELQSRNIVLAIAIDTADAGVKPGLKPEQASEVRRKETFVQPHGSKRYRMSLQILKLGSGEGGSKEEKKTYVISNTGESLFDMIRDMYGQSSKSLWFEHVQVIVFSEAVLKKVGLAEVMDFFERDSEMRSRIKIYVTPGDARELLEYSPPSKEPGGIYLANIARLHGRNNHVAGAASDLGFTTQYLDSHSNLLIPRIEMDDNLVKLGGAAVFKKDNFMGYVDEYTIAGIKITFASEKSAVITIEDPEHPEHQAVFELYRHDTKFRPHVENGNIYYTLDISMYGNIGEIQEEEANAMDPEYIHKLESAFAEEVKRNVLYAERVFKKELRVDCFNLYASKLQAYEPDTWEQVKDRWDEIYPTIPLVISVNVSIRNIGSHK